MEEKRDSKNESEPEDVVRTIEIICSSDDSPSLPKLTPTGKISHAKTRVYTQRYRKDWEQMEDFRGWLTSVPTQPTRAFCTYCDKNLHAHRLSLLKHMCTLKHQRSAAQYNDRLLLEENVPLKRIKLEVTNYEDNDEDEVYSDNELDVTQVSCNNSEQDNEDSIPTQDETQENLQFTTEDESEVHMVVESENDGNEFYEVQQDKSIEGSELETNSNQAFIYSENCDDSIIITDGNDTFNSKDVLIVSNGNAYTIVNNRILNKSASTMKKKEASKINVSRNSTEEVSTVAKTTTTNISKKTTNNINGKTPILSTNVLDTSKGICVTGLQIILYKLNDGRWKFIHESTTSSDGICDDFLKTLTPGRYKFHYDVEKYYNAKRISTIFPFIEIVFDIKDPQRSYHVPLLLSPFSYSTHRDKLREVYEK